MVSGTLQNGASEAAEQRTALARESVPGGETALGRMAFPVGICETVDRLRIRAELPGVDPEKIAVQMDRGQLVITAERADHAADDGVMWLRRETPRGSFYRAFRLGVPVDADGIAASYENGVLTVEMPKAQEARPRLIQISKGGA